jgi:hypothetical protein
MKDRLTKFLAISGTVLAWLPVLAPIIFSVIGYLQVQKFHYDYLMPAELFPVALAGGGLLTWAAIRMRAWLKLIAGSLLAAALLLVASQATAIYTGLASGATPASGWQWAVVVSLLIGYDIAIVLVAVGGLMLLFELFTNAAEK